MRAMPLSSEEWAKIQADEAGRGAGIDVETLLRTLAAAGDTDAKEALALLEVERNRHMTAERELAPAAPDLVILPDIEGAPN